jgi:hypothetical protein
MKKLTKSIGIVLLLVHVGLILSSLVVPLYTDEIAGSKNLVGRYHLDGELMAGPFPHCTAYFEGYQLPRLMRPFAEIAALNFDVFYDGDLPPIAVRAIGIVWYFAALVPLILIFFYLGYGWLGVALGSSVLSLGLMPWILTVNRPEQEMAASLIWSVYLVLRARSPSSESRGSLLADVAKAIALICLAGMLLFVHAKITFFGLIFLLAVYFLVRRHWLRAFVVLSGVFFFVSIYSMHQHWICPESAYISKLYSMYSAMRTHPVEMLTHFMKFLWSHDSHNALNLFGDVGFSDHYPALPPRGATSENEILLNGLAQIATRLLMGLCLAFSCLNLMAFVRRKPFERAHLVGGLLFITLILYRGIYYATNFYEAIWLGPLWVLCLALSATRRPVKVPLALFVAFTAVISIFSGWFLTQRLQNYWPVWRQGGSLPHQPYIIGTMAYDRWKNEILLAAAPCGLEPEKKPSRILVDDVTLYLYQKSERPIGFVNLYEWEPEGPHLQILKDVKSQGAVASCDLLKKIKGLEIHQTGSYCCVKSFAPDPKKK